MAAGNSTRFGSNKLLCNIQGKPMVQYAMEKILKAPFEERVIVTQYKEVEKLAEAMGIPQVRNENPEKGISHSIRLGLQAEAQMDGWMFLVCDQPWISTDTIKRLLEKYREEEKGIGAVRWKDKIGNPVIFSKKYRKELEQLAGDRGGKKILLSHIEDVLFVETDEKELEDLDIPI